MYSTYVVIKLSYFLEYIYSYLTAARSRMETAQTTPLHHRIYEFLYETSACVYVVVV